MSSNVGAIKGKKNMIKLIRENLIPLAAINLVHQIGLKKYKIFSWYNDPEHADGTVDDNINAIMRHFCAHRSGCTIDPESGLPHIFHMACRCGMAVTVYYRSLLQPDNKINAAPVPDMPFNYVGDMLTGEELISLSKVETYVLEKMYTADELAGNINRDLYYIIENGINQRDDILNGATILDKLFIDICMYVKNIWANTNIKEFVKTDVIPKELFSMYNSIFDFDHEMDCQLYRRFTDVN